MTMREIVLGLKKFLDPPQKCLVTANRLYAVEIPISWVYASSRFIFITFSGQVGSTRLTREQAEEYLNWLRGGNRGNYATFSAAMGQAYKTIAGWRRPVG